MATHNKETQKSVRVVLPLTLYNEVKDKCEEYGDLSRVVRHLLRKWVKDSKSTIRQAYDDPTDPNSAL